LYRYVHSLEIQKDATIDVTNDDKMHTITILTSFHIRVATWQTLTDGGLVKSLEKSESIKMDNGIWIFIVVVIILVGGIWLYQTLIEGYANGGFPYAQLGGSYNTQLFSPCVSKRCAGGPYMYTSNPYLQSLCQGVSNEELAQVACGKGFHGRPVHFDYSGLSESVNVGPSINISAPIPTLSKNLEKCGKDLQYGAWGNALCNTPSTTSLCVL